MPHIRKSIKTPHLNSTGDDHSLSDMSSLGKKALMEWQFFQEKNKKEKRIFIERLNFLAAGGVRMCK